MTVPINRPLADLVHDQQPVTLAPDDTVQAACQRMRERRVGCVLVTDQGRLVGIFTGRDAVALLAQNKPADRLQLATAMTRDPTVMAPGVSAMDALRCMQDGGFRHIPIVQDGQVIGVVSRGDFRAIEHARLDEETGLWERL
jgi:CBS domain-containing protein